MVNNHLYFIFLALLLSACSNSSDSNSGDSTDNTTTEGQIYSALEENLPTSRNVTLEFGTIILKDMSSSYFVYRSLSESGLCAVRPKNMFKEVSLYPEALAYMIPGSKDSTVNESIGTRYRAKFRLCRLKLEELISVHEKPALNAADAKCVISTIDYTPIANSILGKDNAQANLSPRIDTVNVPVIKTSNGWEIEESFMKAELRFPM